MHSASGKTQVVIFNGSNQIIQHVAHAMNYFAKETIGAVWLIKTILVESDGSYTAVFCGNTVPYTLPNSIDQDLYNIWLLYSP
jgi:hypothetical protein